MSVPLERRAEIIARNTGVVGIVRADARETRPSQIDVGKKFDIALVKNGAGVFALSGGTLGEMVFQIREVSRAPDESVDDLRLGDVGRLGSRDFDIPLLF